MFVNFFIILTSQVLSEFDFQYMYSSQFIHYILDLNLFSSNIYSQNNNWVPLTFNSFHS